MKNDKNVIELLGDLVMSIAVKAIWAAIVTFPCHMSYDHYIAPSFNFPIMGYPAIFWTVFALSFVTCRNKSNSND